VVRAWCDRLPDGASLDELEQLADATLTPDAGVAIPLRTTNSAETPDSRGDQVLDALSRRTGIRTDVCPPLREVVTGLVAHPAVTPDRLVDTLLADPLGDAHDPLAVLTWRARQHARTLGIPDYSTPQASTPRRKADEPTFSTTELLDTERQAFDHATQARASVSVDPRLVDAVLRGDEQLSDEQRAMVRHITTTPQGVQIVVGRAGAGKTTALAAAVPLWRAAGCSITATALAARTAQQLGEEADIPAMTIQRLLHCLNQQPPRHTDVIVVDEAAMVGTRTLARLIDHSSGSGARLVLVGDHHQLPEIDAGGLFATLAHHLPHVELTTNRRQRNPGERAAVDGLRAGHPEAVAHFSHPDRYTTHPTHHEAIAAIVEGWWADRQTGRTTLMLAGHQADVDALNAQARHHLQQIGALTGTPLATPRGEFQTGDEVLCLVNNRRIGVLNGTLGRIDTIADGHLLLTTTHHGREVLLPSSYWQSGGIAHAYATTVHKAQGRTVDTTHLLLTDDAYREMTYVMLSRHRDNLAIHTTNPTLCEDQHRTALAADHVSDLVAHAARHSAQKSVAHQTL
jgi:ATP-dependent exoDNAse (exonuclease V) alpha subunit